jgi:hypothetical protein
MVSQIINKINTIQNYHKNPRRKREREKERKRERERERERM